MEVNPSYVILIVNHPRACSHCINGSVPTTNQVGVFDPVGSLLLRAMAHNDRIEEERLVLQCQGRSSGFLKMDNLNPSFSKESFRLHTFQPAKFEILADILRVSSWSIPKKNKRPKSAAVSTPPRPTG